MPRETCTAPATLPLFSTSGASRTSTTSALPLAIISFARAGVIFGTTALAVSIICLTLSAIFTSLVVEQAFALFQALPLLDDTDDIGFLRRTPWRPRRPR